MKDKHFNSPAVKKEKNKRTKNETGRDTQILFVLILARERFAHKSPTPDLLSLPGQVYLCSHLLKQPLHPEANFDPDVGFSPSLLPITLT